MNFEDLKDPELQGKLKSAKTPEELVAIAQSEGIALSDDQLEALSGGEATKMSLTAWSARFHVSCLSP